MKKLNAAAVFVLLMVSATNVFADANCLGIYNEIMSEKASVAERTERLHKTNGYIIETQSQIITNQSKSGDQSFILADRQEGLHAYSVILFRSRAQDEEGIRAATAKIENLKKEYMKECSSFDKFE